MNPSTKLGERGGNNGASDYAGHCNPTEWCNMAKQMYFTMETVAFYSGVVKF
jgi:hypothetical protein